MKNNSSDLTFITNEPGSYLSDRFGVLLHRDTRHFDCLVGYFFISGFYKLYPVLEKVEKINFSWPTNRQNGLRIITKSERTGRIAF